MNKVFLIGNLGCAPQFTKGQEDKQDRVRFTLAVQRRNDDVDWFSVVAFNGTARAVVENLGTGDRVALEDARLHSYSFDHGGRTHQGVEVVAKRITFIKVKKWRETEKPDQVDDPADDQAEQS